MYLQLMEKQVELENEMAGKAKIHVYSTYFITKGDSQAGSFPPSDQIHSRTRST